MKFEAETWYGERMMDFVKFAEAYGAYGERVESPADIRPAIMRATESKRPVIIEVIVERETDASIGTAIDRIVEYEPLPSTTDEKVFNAVM